jgi:hypothetical protein
MSSIRERSLQPMGQAITTCAGSRKAFCYTTRRITRRSSLTTNENGGVVKTTTCRSDGMLFSTFAVKHHRIYAV